MTGLRCQQVRIRELELETLRLSMQKKQEELFEARDLHKQSVRDINELLVAGNFMTPNLPTEIIEKIFVTLCWDEVKLGDNYTGSGVPRSPEKSCVARLLDSPSTPSAWKDLLSRHFPHEAKLSSDKRGKASTFQWTVCRGHFSYWDDFQELESLRNDASVTVNLQDIPDSPFDASFSGFTPICRHRWDSLVIGLHGWSLFQFLLENFSSSIRTVRSFAMESEIDAERGKVCKDGEILAFDGSDSPFKGLRYATIHPTH